MEKPIIRIDGLLTEYGFSGGPGFHGKDLVGWDPFFQPPSKPKMQYGPIQTIDDESEY